MKPLVSGAHALIYSHDAEADRAFFRDVLGFDSVDSGGGWLIFALPPSELAIHQTEKELERRKVPITRPFDEERWGRVTRITLPGGGRIGLYQPKHPLAHAKPRASQSRTGR